MKSTKLGLGFVHNHTKKSARMTLLVLLTTLTAMVLILMVLILLGNVVELAGLAYRFHSSSTRKRRARSHFFLGKRALTTNLKISLKQWQEGIRQFAEHLFKEEGFMVEIRGDTSDSAPNYLVSNQANFRLFSTSSDC